MKINKRLFGELPDKTEAYLYEIDTGKGMKAVFTNYGARIISLQVPDRNNNPVDVILGFESLKEYLHDPSCFGAIVGRYANRIHRARFKIDDKVYHLSATIHGYSLHGGKHGFYRVLWQAEPYSKENEAGIYLRHFSAHLEDGFPGNLEVEVCYKLTADFCWRIEYRAKTDQKTHLNLTNHAYFNLSGIKTDINNHEVMINAETTTEVDSNIIPTGKILPIKGTALDFSKPRKMKLAFELIKNKGFDHNFILKRQSAGLEFAALVYEPTTGIRLETWTTEPAVQFYTANHLRHVRGKNNIYYEKFWGFCLETQHFPDSPNHSHFPSTLIEPAKPFYSCTEYRFFRGN